MNRPQNRSSQRRSRRPKPPPPVDLWQTAPVLPDAERIIIPSEVSALLQSLGDAPTIGGSIIVGGYFAAVVERTAAVAAALASSADLLAEPADD